jgi:hypothetical protein
VPTSISTATTADIAFNAPATGTGSIQAALEAQAPLTGNVSVTPAGTAGVERIYNVVFVGALGNTYLPPLVGVSSLTGFGATLQVNVLTPGDATNNAVQELRVGGTGGTYTLSYLDITALGHEMQMALDWVESVLRGDTSGLASIPGIQYWTESLPSPPPALSVLWGRNTDADIHFVGNIRAGARCLVNIEVVAQANDYDQRTRYGGERIDELFHGVSNVVIPNPSNPGGLIRSCKRLTQIAMSDTAPTGEQLFRAGGIFEIIVQRS